MTRLVVLIVALLLALPDTALAAARKPLHVLTLQSDDAVTQAHALTAALKRAVSQSRKYSLADGEFSLEVMTLALGCADPPDEGCLTQIAAKIKGHQFVWGTMERRGQKLLVHLRLWQRGGEAREVIARYRANHERDRLDEMAGALLGRLSGDSAAGDPSESLTESEDPDPSEEPRGDLVVYAGNVDGQLVIDGRASGKVKNGFAKVAVPAGDHEVLVRASGYYEAIAQVEVEPKRRAEVTLYPEPRGRVRRRAAEAGESSSDSAGGWAAIAVGGLLVGGGVYSALKVSSINEDPALERYRAAFPKNQNACIEAGRGTERPGTAPASQIADLCQEERTYKALQYLFFGLGGVAIGTGAFILAVDTDPSEGTEKEQARARKVTAEPQVAVGRTSAEVGVRLQF